MAKRKKADAALTPIPRHRGSLTPPDQLLDDLRGLIRQTRTGVAQAVNSTLVLLYWEVGHRIRTEILKEQRAAYGQEILSTLSKELTAEFGSGFSIPNLSRMMRLAEVFPEQQIVSTLSRRLSWSHFIQIIPLKDDLKRDFYAEMCRIECWSVRTLQKKIGGMLFERTALSRKPAELAKQELEALRQEDLLTPDLVFRDPYFLDVRHDNREGIADAVSRTLGRRCLSRPTYLKSKDNREHSLLVKRLVTTKGPDHAPQGLRSRVKATLLELQFHRTSGSPVGRAFDDDANRSGRLIRARSDPQRSG